MRIVDIIDTTLRDGAQTPGIVFSQNNRLKIISLLQKAGIKKIECGIPVMGTNEQQSIRDFRSQFPNLHFIGWCRARFEDIRASVSALCSSIHISFPVSDCHLKIQKKNQDLILAEMEALVSYAQQRFEYVSVGAQDASRADISFLIQFVKRANEMGVNNIRIADTVGVLTPRKTMMLFSLLRHESPTASLEIHAHNDLGMATAVALTALESGAHRASVTVNGIGERAGNAALEELAMALTIQGDIDCQIDTTVLKELSDTVARITGRQLSPGKAVVGDSVFTHESGIHCHGLEIDKTSYEPFAPELAGHAGRTFAAGSHSGSSTIENILREKGIALQKNESRLLLTLAQKAILATGKSLSSNVVLELYRRLNFNKSLG